MKMNFEIVVSERSAGSLEKFWKAMNIWLKSPHLVNRRISSRKHLLTAKVECNPTEIFNTISKAVSLTEMTEHGLKNEGVRNFFNISDKCTPLPQSYNLLEESSTDIYLLISEYLPRDPDKFSSGIEFTIVDKRSKSLLCYHRSIDPKKRCLSSNTVYKITFDDENQFSISVDKRNVDSLEPSSLWLREKLFSRLRKWIENDRSNDDALVNGSLNLVSPEKYTRLYNELKQKYGLEMVKKWPECTDPNKFVYEDVAIATYLILLWESERTNGEENKQSFVDLGCGNGLLVHILTSEGYPGTGIDLRKRQIWDIYPNTTHLVEQTIVPSSSTLFPDADWLIGNHSDELTPWIPVIAARSSYKCRFFLLPCCAHEFDGRKFQRDSASKSQYFEYMKYVKSVCEGCGFATNLDKLRIPSTKRICLVGRERNYPREMIDRQDKLIDGIINARSQKGKKSSESEENKVLNSSQWSTTFKPRESLERVKNCTKVDRTVIDEIISVATKELLRKVRNITLKDDRTWNAGGQIELAEIAKIIEPEFLKQLRNECGGLQTLFKNNSHIFRVIDGSVQFRVPGTEIISNKKRKNNNKLRIKVKPCWFYENHPDGCPVGDEICNFKHSTERLER